MALQDTPGSGDTHVMPLRIERGAVAEATDGPVGTIEQIIMDRTSGQVSALVIQSSDTGNEFELPARYADAGRSTNHHVYLKLSRRELLDNPDMVRPYNPEQYTPVYQGEAMPEQAATRMAAESERPVITDIEENAAELVVADADQSPAQPAARTDTGVGTGTTTGRVVPSARADMAEDATPTVKLNATQPSTGQSIRGDQDTAPAPEVSATPATTGALMGGKPSTSGMGEKSYVPPSPAPALDTVPTSPNLPPYTVEHPPEEAAAPGMEPANATPVGSSAYPASQALVDEMPATTAADTGAGGTPESVPPPDLALGGGETPVLTETVITAGAGEPTLTDRTPAQPQMLDTLKDRMPSLLLSLGRSPVVLLAAGGLTAGIVAGIALRRRNDPGYQARRAVNRTKDRAQSAAGQAKAQAGITASQARDAAAQLAQSAQTALKRTGDRVQAKAQEAQARMSGGTDQLSDQAKGTAKETASQVAAQTKATAAQMRDQAKAKAAQVREQAKAGAEQARGQAKDAGRQARKGAKRTARRFRWFRRGLVVGGAVSILYAPQPGAELRTRLSNTIEELRSRIA